MKINILTFNNKSGIVTNAYLLKKLLSSKYECKIFFLENKENIPTSDVAIWIQNYYIDELKKFKINIFDIYEEWCDYPIESLRYFDYVICKSQYTKNKFFKNLDNVILLPSISKNLYEKNISTDSNKILHFKGRSIQKNTECLLDLNHTITIHDPNNNYKNLPINFTHVNKHLSKFELKTMLNSHNIHICCSLYESWGHYLFESLSTGAEIICSDIPIFREYLDPDLVHFIPTEKNINLNYKYCRDNINNLYPLRESYFINVDLLKELINDFQPKGTPYMRRMLYKSIMEKNKKEIISFFKNI